MDLMSAQNPREWILEISELRGAGLERPRHTVHGCLSAQLFQHFGGFGESVARFADGDVHDQLLDAELPHGIRALVFPRLGLCGFESALARIL